MALRDGRKKSWFYIENDIIDRTDLNKHEKYLYMVLARYVDKEDKAFPSYTELSEKAGLGRTTIIKAIKTLEEKGLLTKVTRHKENSKENHSNLYTLKSARTMISDVLEDENQEESTPLGGACDEPPSASDEPRGALGVREQDSLNNTSTNNIPHDSGEEESQTNFEPEVVDLVKLLSGFITRNNPRQPVPEESLDNKRYKTWLVEIDRLHRIGPPGGNKGYSYQEIRDLIIWSQSDSFWLSNILSATKLRKQAPKLEIQMNNSKKSKGGVNHGKNGNVRRRAQASIQEQIAKESEERDSESTKHVDF